MTSSNKLVVGVLMFFSIFSLSSCEAIGGIFKAGMWMGVILVVVVIALVLWLMSKMRK